MMASSLAVFPNREVFETDSEHSHFMIQYDTDKLMDLVKSDSNIKEVPIPILDLAYILNMQTWVHHDHPTPLTPNQVIQYPTIDGKHYKRIIDADLKYPLFVRHPRLARGKIVVINGVHRLARAYHFLPGMTHIMVQFIPDATLDACRINAIQTSVMSTEYIDKKMNDGTASDLTMDAAFDKFFAAIFGSDTFSKEGGGLGVSIGGGWSLI